MRPTRLELEGFSSFREKTVVDFSGAELFVLTGPTGAGKSSLIDAMTFALYGSVHRYGAKDVAPVVTQGRIEAKVRLDFEVEGKTYTAVRVVRRTKSGGATTSQARLEQGTVELALGADEVTRQVTRLIGLPFDHFTRCVVLPQGEFARFLHDKPGERQGLLVKLLDLEIYGRMATAANLRSRTADERIKLAQERLEKGLAHATLEARDAAKAAIVRFGALATRIDRSRPKLDELKQRADKLVEDERGAAALARQLDALVAPAGDLELARQVEVGAAAARKAGAAVEEAASETAAAAAARKALPAAEPLRETLEKHRRAAEQQAALAKAVQGLETARKTEGAAEKALGQAKTAAAGAQRALDATTQANLAAALASTLGVGDTCPVCGVEIRQPPHAETPKDLKKAQVAVEAAKRAQDLAESKRREAHAAAERLNGEVAAREAEVDALHQALAKAPARDVLEATLQSILKADEALSRAREREGTRSAALVAAGKAMEAARKSESAAWQRLDSVRVALAALGPPPVDSRDLAAAWAALGQWSRREAPKQRERADAARAEAGRVAAAVEKIRAEIAAAMLEAGLEQPTGDPRAACSEALAGARETLRGVDAAIEEAKQLRDDIAVQQETSRVARFLALHLGARNFESWVLNRVMQGLAAGASQRLLELSRDQYSFELDEKNRDFLVVDHDNAGEVRSARTLSGGETFLASLALALALSEHVARLAARGAARLDALFLDEGFGALDPETLEVVAGAIENLGASGHMVGIVTHVRELAERIPVRFEVTKDARTSSVERVDG